jgi:peroxiredoxin
MLLKIIIVGLVLSWGVILTGCWLGWQLLSQNGRNLLRLEDLEKRLNELELSEGEERTGLPIGSETPVIELQDLAGERKSLAQYRGRPVLLIFFNPSCGFCRELLPKLKVKVESTEQKAEINAESEQLRNGPPPDRTSVLIVTSGDFKANRSLFAEHHVGLPVWLQKGSEVAEAYQVNGTPSGYLISSEGKIASEIAMGADALLSLLEDKSQIANPKSEIAGDGEGRAARFANRSLDRSKIKRDGLKPGTLAPEFTLPRLDGRNDLALSQLHGKRVLLVFSSPHCGPCNALAPELEKFHRAHPELEVVMISKGEPKENRAKVKEHGLTFPIVLQQQWEVSRRYAMFATPIAYFIDEQGIVTKDVAVGVEPILAMLEKIEERRAKPAEVVVNGQFTVTKAI